MRRTLSWTRSSWRGMPGGPGYAALHHRRDLPGTRLGWYDVRLTRAMVVQVVLVVLVAGSVVAMSPARAAASVMGLTARTCASIYTGDRVRRLDVCTRGYIGPGYVTGVVEMHTYRWLAVCRMLQVVAGGTPSRVPSR
jgi:hypothetical protein